MHDTVSLWQLLKQKSIVIPRIQRDYAQGRKGMEHIRSSFLQEIEEHLRNETDFTLDFVYGNADPDRFYPLDGQQRLTTLWLIHWFLAFKTGNLAAVKNILNKFSYDTRQTSQQFCRELCEKMVDADLKGMRISEYIHTQTWFYSQWMQDPTISAMLCTISGDPSENFHDNIEEIFRGKDLQKYWKDLTECSRNTFKLMIIGSDKLPLSDDLYIKMNARGKKLTDFENFKADWIYHIQKSDDKTNLIGGKLYSQYYPEKMDNCWTDVFWNSAKSAADFDGNIDSIFLAFINRYVLNQICIYHNAVSPSNFDQKSSPVDDVTREIQKQFSELYRVRNTKQKKVEIDDAIPYRGFELYRPYLGPNALKSLDMIFTNLLLSNSTDQLKISNVDDHADASLADANTTGDFSVIPAFRSKGIVPPITQKERIYFHALCLYLESPIPGKLNAWWRIVTNLVENAMVNTVDRMITCLRFIDGLGRFLSSKNWEVYPFLDQYPYAPDINSQLGRQWVEEIEKAKQIHIDSTFEEKITKAESLAFFNGSIRFLYHDEKGSVNWDNFDTKHRNAATLFNIGNKIPVETVIRFLSMFRSPKEINDLFHYKSYVFSTIGYHPRHFCWKTNILCNEDLTKHVHELLMKPAKDSAPDRSQGVFHEFINDKDAIGEIWKWESNYKYRFRGYPDTVLRRDHNLLDGIYLSDDIHSKIQCLKSLPNVSFSPDNPTYGNFIWGLDICFTYNGRTFRYGRDNEIRADDGSQRVFKWKDANIQTLKDELAKL